MATNMKFLVNYVDPAVKYETTPADYRELDLANDSLVWTKGSAIVTDLMGHQPIASELNAAAEIIDPVLPVTVSMCLLSTLVQFGGPYNTHLVKGMGTLTDQYVFCFSFDGATATEPQLEAWDDSTHLTFVKNVLGVGNALNSFVKAACTTLIVPGTYVEIAGGSNVILLNAGSGALTIASDLYANIKIVIPGGYAIPAAESFVLTTRYTYF